MSTCGSKRISKTKRRRISKCRTSTYLRSKKGNRSLIALRGLPKGRINYLARNAIAMANVGLNIATKTSARVCPKILFVIVMRTATFNFTVTLTKNGPTNQFAVSIRKMESVALKTFNAPSTISAGTPVRKMLQKVKRFA